jgi:hypothetical protein
MTDTPAEALKAGEAWDEIVRRNREAPRDCRPDNTGLDDGPYLPGCAPRKRMEPKDPAIVADIRARAWATRRAKYGKDGHR